MSIGEPRARSIPPQPEGVEITTCSMARICQNGSGGTDHAPRAEETVTRRSSLMISGNSDESLNIRTISMPNFDVSWAGHNPAKPGYWFGSDDGWVSIHELGWDQADRPVHNLAGRGSCQRDRVHRRAHGCEHPKRCHLHEGPPGL